MKVISFLVCLSIVFLGVFLGVFLDVPLALAQTQGATAVGLDGLVGPVSIDLEPLIDAVRSGSMIAVAAVAITLLVDLLKTPWLGGLASRVPRRWRIAFPVALGGMAGILSDILGGLPWQEALFVGLFSGPTAVFAHEAVVEAILGRSRTRDSEIMH
ncbi:MAG TPA: hypothetical protein VNM90_14340 [Haliangium sp.]|nr:hypothetical protein [Haliangium sp.]